MNATHKVALSSVVHQTGAYSPGVPAAFLANYSAASAFLSALETTFCRTRTHVAQLRDSAAHASFLRRWKLSAYFGLRFQVGHALSLLWSRTASGDGKASALVALSLHVKVQNLSTSGLGPSGDTSWCRVWC